MLCGMPIHIRSHPSVGHVGEHSIWCLRAHSVPWETFQQWKLLDSVARSLEDVGGGHAVATLRGSRQPGLVTTFGASTRTHYVTGEDARVAILETVFVSTVHLGRSSGIPPVTRVELKKTHQVLRQSVQRVGHSGMLKTCPYFMRGRL